MNKKEFEKQAEQLHRRLNSVRQRALKKVRNRRLKQKNFTLISNNCWAGMVYQAYDLEKQSPTVGLFFYSPEYILFLKHIHEALSGELRFIKPQESRYWNELKERKDGYSFPIGVLPGGAEICFLHYHSEKEARDKWTRRCKRVCWEKMIVKFNDQNLCTEEDMKAFDKLEFAHKLIFTCRDWPIPRDHYIKIRQFPKRDCLQFSWEPFSDTTHFKMTKLLNTL